MEKLLHERMREYANSDLSRPLRCVIKSKSGGYKDVFNAIADEIERCYTHNGDLDEIFADWIERMAKGGVEFPKIRAAIDKWCLWRPRFEDGEPVQFGDKFLRWDGKNGNDGENVTEIAVQSGDHYRWSLNGDCYTSQFVKRPTPKVYDADGVETKAGDEGFGVQTGCEMTVLFVQPDDEEYALFVRCKDGSEIYLQANQFTHERPVFDAEGVRICKGDTVWGILLHDKHEVSLVKNGCVYLDDGSICFNPTQLTHREPDSLEKLRDDMKGYVYEGKYHGSIDVTLDGWCNRLTALIEMDA